jgi:hypothetical protein
MRARRFPPRTRPHRRVSRRRVRRARDRSEMRGFTGSRFHSLDCALPQPGMTSGRGSVVLCQRKRRRARAGARRGADCLPVPAHRPRHGLSVRAGLHTTLTAMRLGDRLGHRPLYGVADLFRVPALPRGVYGLVYPRVTPVRGGGHLRLDLVLRGPVRGSVHSDDAIEAVLRESGLSRQSSIGVGRCSSPTSSRFRMLSRPARTGGRAGTAPTPRA